ncbi:MAG: hypothetical protein IPJ40_23415 [Saprospirales bacterium]|nr:hypothetical protein [Saprospirales bacterium]
MAPLYYRKDRPVLPVTGLFQYEPKDDTFIFGDSLKVATNSLKGNLLTFYNGTGKVEAEGRFDIGKSLKYISVEAAGRAETMADVMSADTLSPGPGWTGIERRLYAGHQTYPAGSLAQIYGQRHQGDQF